MDYFAGHLERLRREVRETYSLSEAPKWIEKHTTIKGLPYSYLNHEFQLEILSDVSRVVNTQKCSQVGLTEAMFRWVAAMSQIIPEMGIIITLPFSGDASEMAKTRFDPIIEGSTLLKEVVNRGLNNSEVKQLGRSLVYFRGSNGRTQAISTPADAVVSDEIDRSDPDILSQFTSRLTHSPFKLRRNFSTPTVPGWGISLEMDTSRRFRNMCKCNHCNAYFVPDFFQHVRIPGFSGDFREITKYSLPRLRYLEAQLHCPKCDLVPSLQKDHRERVQENTLDNYEAAGYFVAPFDAPNLITIPSLFVASTGYRSYTEFVNQNLGLPEQNDAEAMIAGEVKAAMHVTDLHSKSHLHVMGIDVGLWMWITIGRITPEGILLVVHRERVLLGNFEKRRVELKQQFRVVMTVMDAFPYTSMVLDIQGRENNFFGGVYTAAKALQSYSVKMNDGTVEEGKLPIHQASINRDVAMDELMGLFKRNKETGMARVVIQKVSEEIDDLTELHYLDMRRVQEFTAQQEMKYVWHKSKEGNDHLWHSLLYCYVAARLMPTITAGLPSAIPLLISKFTVKSGKPIRAQLPTNR